MEPRYASLMWNADGTLEDPSPSPAKGPRIAIMKPHATLPNKLRTPSVTEIILKRLTLPSSCCISEPSITLTWKLKADRIGRSRHTHSDEKEKGAGPHQFETRSTLPFISAHN